MMNRGFVLIGAIIIIILFAVLGIFGASMLSTDIEISQNAFRSSQAFFLAEAGLQEALYELKTNTSFRNSPSLISLNLSTGNFFVEVTNTSSLSYTINSTGNVLGVDGVAIRRVVQQNVTISWPPAFDYALAVFGDNSSGDVNMELRMLAGIWGDLYADGDVTVGWLAGVFDGLVYADSVGGIGTYTPAGGPPDPIPTYPTQNTSYYDNQLSIAASNSSGDLDLTGNQTMNLNNGTYYYDNVTVRSGSTLVGPGTVVATGGVKIQGFAVGTPSLTIISGGDIDVEGLAAVRNDSTLYAKNNIDVQAVAGVDGALIAEDRVRIRGGALATGIIMADELELQLAAAVRGSVVCNRLTGNDIKRLAGINFSTNWFPNISPVDLGLPFSLRREAWKETE